MHAVVQSGKDVEGLLKTQPSIIKMTLIHLVIPDVHDIDPLAEFIAKFNIYRQCFSEKHDGRIIFLQVLINDGNIVILRFDGRLIVDFLRKN